MEKAPDKETQENLRLVAQLKSYLAEGYLLHGSKQKVEMLEPRQASDDNPLRTTGKAHAIYAEAHDVRIPILMALFAQKDLGKGGGAALTTAAALTLNYVYREKIVRSQMGMYTFYPRTRSIKRVAKTTLSIFRQRQSFRLRL